MAITTQAKPTQDPGYKRLGAAILIQAARDLTNPDPVKSLDALTWLLFGGSEIYEGLDLDPERGALAILRTIQISRSKNHAAKEHKLTRLTG